MGRPRSAAGHIRLDGTTSAPGVSLPAAVLQRLSEWFAVVGDEPWRAAAAAGAEALVKELREELNHEITAAGLRTWFNLTRSFTNPSQAELRDLVGQINEHQPAEEKIATTHEGFILVQGRNSPFGYKGIDFHVAMDAYRARISVNGKQEAYLSWEKLDAALWYSLRCAKKKRPLADWEADLLEKVCARSVQQERKETKKKEEKKAKPVGKKPRKESDTMLKVGTDDDGDDEPAEPLPWVIPEGYTVVEKPSSLMLAPGSKEAKALVGVTILYHWEEYGWCEGVIEKANGDKSKMIDGETANFLVYYEMDDDLSRHVLALGSYEADGPPNSWVLIASTYEVQRMKNISANTTELEARGLGTPHTQTGKRRRS